ncbi:hypothetical protein PLICRDRAFT_57292 [Plicaturopsis crispa FD-325 SS-3]|uniref:Enhancer of polycomb-like protein n=1 Tax=Plicaturopsis crispa FD-325 SS-3 TaxID=944288 RepID=A0A0C9SRL2_PLICR|nr:hypothetical protein PLICRDRAFT_57292 [Plicaturopsis crispa FD-325 SS-3]
MPRIHNMGTSTLRNRNRVTTKTILRVVKGDIDADPLVIEEDEERARVISTAGVDIEDANEHHLQAVLSAAVQRHHSTQRATRGAAAAAESTATKPAAAFIPIPDHAGLAENYEELYPPGVWRDHETYVRTSETVDECTADALNGPFTYYMDERDNDWLAKNNEEARGEGTSAQGAVSSGGTTTRSGAGSRSSKAKGKEPEAAQPSVISEDEFELVMGIFEKITHEKTEYLHMSLEQGMPFPPFSDYQDVFAYPLSPALFAGYIVPSWINPGPQLLRIARTIYPYWRERRIERGGHQIIPVLNFDETDLPNESYVCFRRREGKSARKTRASHAVASDKLMRLQREFTAAMDLTQTITHREKIKKNVFDQHQTVWEKRASLVDLKRKFPSLGTKEDDELLQDKERAPKRQKNESSARITALKLRTRDDSATHPHTEYLVRPKEKLAAIQSQIEKDLQKQKERDNHWEDRIENGYQQLPAPYAARHFKFIPPPGAPSSSLFGKDDDDENVKPRALRIRIGRCGRPWLDRRPVDNHRSTTASFAEGVALRRALRSQSPELTEADKAERAWRLESQFKFDTDDCPPVGPEGPDEHDRVLIDDYAYQHIAQTMTLITDDDHRLLVTDPTLVVSTSDGRQQSIVPIRQPPHIRAMPSRGSLTVATPAQQHNAMSLSVPMHNGQAISVMKKMQQSNALPHMRISSNGGMRPPSAPSASSSVPGMPMSSIIHMSPPATPSQQPNGQHETGSDTKPHVQNGVAPDSSSTPDGSPTRPKSQQQQQPIAVPNGYHIPAVNGFPPATPYHHGQPPALSVQQMQSIKSAFATMPPGTDVNAFNLANARQAIPAAYLNGMPNGNHVNGNYNNNMKLPASRQLSQWTPGGMTNGSMSPSPNMGHAAVPPARTPSANGMRRVPSQHLGQGPHPMSPHLQHSPPTMQGQPHSSPPRPMASPSLQHQQAVGASQGGY